MTTATGVSAITAAATSPAEAPNQRRTVRYRTTTVATPARAWGARTAHGLNPKARMDRPVSQIDAGGLSMVMNPAASNPPKNQAFQDEAPLAAAAA
jgi:hypothetical protein